MVRWNNNSAVITARNTCNTEHLIAIKIYSRKKSVLQTQKSRFLADYKYMKIVDLTDKGISKYRMSGSKTAKLRGVIPGVKTRL